MADKKVKKEKKVLMSVYDLKQGVHENGKWIKKGSSVIREAVKVNNDFAKLVNDNFDNSGRYYELNKKADEEYQKLREKKK